jgi:hypothetical protein
MGAAERLRKSDPEILWEILAWYRAHVKVAVQPATALMISFDYDAEVWLFRLAHFSLPIMPSM